MHPALLSLLDEPRAAAALALCLAPRAAAESVAPTLLPILLHPSSGGAAAQAAALIDDAEAAAAVLGAYQQLSIAALAAVASALDPAPQGLCIAAAAPGFAAAQLGPTWCAA